MEVWIQRHDHHVDNHSELGRDQCLVLLDSFDWESELTQYEEALERNEDRCPPGMGFVDGDRTLHVMPIHDDKSHYHYSCNHPVRLLATFGASRQFNVWAVPNRHRHRLIGLHYAGKQDELVRALLEHAD